MASMSSQVSGHLLKPVACYTLGKLTAVRGDRIRGKTLACGNLLLQTLL